VVRGLNLLQLSDSIVPCKKSGIRRVGLMGGTFDPVHYGHLVTAEVARAKFLLDLVVFVPAGIPPHKKGIKISQGTDRYMMTVLATVSNPFFKVSRAELDRPGPSYAIDTVEYFCTTFDKGTEIFFITGADAAVEILTWKDAKDLLKKCGFIVATRPGYSTGELKGHLKEAKLYSTHCIYTVEVPALAISSTDIRRRVKQGEPIRYLLPRNVENYIYKTGLYCPNKITE
jgi:nicotinate-nucleotide adenylyltransferase